MTDPLRTNPSERTSSTHGDAERDAKIESLLIAGLDQYFAADYAQAIDIWTRALFIDRNHARARAYIERARSAMAEQQRESEELLHNGVAAFERGEIEAARQMLTAAVQRGGAHDVALAFLTRIDRIHAATAAQPEPMAPPSRLPFRPRTVTSDRPGSRWASAVFVVLLIATAAVAIASRDQLGVWIPALSTGAQDGLAPMRVVQEPLIVPRSSETALDRARALFESGRVYDALRAVDLVRPTDPLRGDADKLKEAIQRKLLALETLPGGSALTNPANPTNPPRAARGEGAPASEAARSGAGGPRD
jgi:tetratricopeptide (TPR) repeat protein